METGIRTLTLTDLQTTTPLKLEAYGAAGFAADGRRFRYFGNGASAIVAGNLVVAPALVTNHQNLAVVTAVPANATSVVVTLGATAATVDQYAEGTLVVGVAGSGVPVTLKIRGNTSGNAGGTITVSLATSSPVPFALNSTNVVNLAPSVFNGSTASTTAGYPVGVVTTNVAANAFGWIQVYGPVGVVNDAGGLLTTFTRVKQSTTVAGAVVASTLATDVQVGTQLQSTAASTAGLALISLD